MGDVLEQTESGKFTRTIKATAHKVSNPVKP